MISLAKTDWVLTGDPGVSRQAGGINPLNVGPQNAYSLRVPVNAFTAGPPIFFMDPNVALATLQTIPCSIEFWIKPTLLAAGFNLYAIGAVRSGCPASFGAFAGFTAPGTFEVSLLELGGGSPIFSTGPLAFNFAQACGVRLRANDDIGGIKFQLAHNVNGAGWTPDYSAISPLGIPSLGIPGGWQMMFGSQVGAPGVGDFVLIDDVKLSNEAPV